MPQSDFTPDEPEFRKPPIPARRRRRDEEDDDYDREEDERRFRRNDDDGGLSTTIIPYRNAMALIAYYCGVFSLIPFLGNLLGPAALLLGILGIRYAMKNPTAKGTGHAIAGIVLGSITTLIYWGLAIVFVIVALTHK
jgi:hypothetical protein